MDLRLDKFRMNKNTWYDKKNVDIIGRKVVE